MGSMEELAKAAANLQLSLAHALKQLDVDNLVAQKAAIDKQVTRTDFWQNTADAQATTIKQAQLERRIAPWLELKESVAYLAELAHLGDESVRTDLETQLAKAQQQFDELKNELKLAGPYDDHNVIISIFAGAGGTDAQDWAEMLLRMYVRWAEKNKYSIKTIDESAGDEAGIKSVTLEIDGSYAYGKLKGEHGVHRLVRLSPFNADHLRQTSFAKVDVLPKIEHPEDLKIDDKDLRIDVFRSGGHGGQSVNTTDSAVRVTHIPTGITVAIQNERSQLQNKETALTIVRSRLTALRLEQHTEKIDQLKGPNQSAEWGNQIRSYVLHPYKQVKDLRTKFESSDVDSVLNGNLEPLIIAYLDHTLA